LIKSQGMTRGKVILFIPEDTEQPAGLSEMLGCISVFAVTEIVRSLGDLSREILSQVHRRRPVVIVVPLTRADLENLVNVCERFENSRIVLVLPDADEQTVALGHRMRPRFVGYLGNGLAQITEVVRKMLVGSDPAGQYARGGLRHDRNETKCL
jgi:hypothetical protein